MQPYILLACLVSSKTLEFINIQCTECRTDPVLGSWGTEINETQTLLESSSRVQTTTVETDPKCQPNDTYMPPKHPTT